MKAYEIMNLLFSWAEAGTFERTCDTKKCGDENVEVKKVAVAMFGTLGVVKAAKEWGAELLVVHEPLYYTHMDEHTDEKGEIFAYDISEIFGGIVISLLQIGSFFKPRLQAFEISHGPPPLCRRSVRQHRSSRCRGHNREVRTKKRRSGHARTA